MAEAELDEIPQEVSVTALAVEMGLITQQEAQLAEARHKALHRVGIRLTLGQTLVERKFLDPAQIKTLMAEFDKRTAHAGLRRNQYAGVSLSRFGHYDLLEVLSQKSHCRVIKAHDNIMGRLVILKILTSSTKDDPSWNERFRREMQVLGKLSHPNLVQAYAAEEIDGCPVLAMEYVEGPTLGERIDKEGIFPEKEAWLIGREVAKALAYAAKQGIIHRDIKPDNIVCSRNGRVKLIDLGFSKSIDDRTQLTVEGTTVGTPFYISPEQAMGTRDIDPRADIYSLGCTIYHMLTGQPPFWGDQVTDVMLKHCEAERPNPRKLVPTLCEGTAKLVLKMIAVNPEKRPPSADAVVDEINALIPTLPKLYSGVQEAPQPIARSKVKEVMRIPARPPESSQKKGFWNRVKRMLMPSRHV
ncbi:MAG TPA: serine/threonine-protein kinase [Planctomycetota bacterium]|nr:serine/threonine-protein kinase [Planctomycetota bacterium]